MSTPNDHRPALQPPRFGLSTLLVAITLLCSGFALLGVVGPFYTLAAALVAAAIVAHVAGNAIGSRLRQLGDTPISASDPPPNKPARRVLAASDFAPATRLGQRFSLGLINLTLTMAGVVLGGMGGGVLFLNLYWEQANPLNIGVGMLAFAILGGIGTFVTVGFFQVMISALIQANAGSKRDGH